MAANSNTVYASLFAILRIVFGFFNGFTDRNVTFFKRPECA
jgi:hypothetical protein